MERPIEILHIDSNWESVYFHKEKGLMMEIAVPLKTALFLLKDIKFDLIISEPQNMAILNPQTQKEESESSSGR